MPMQRFQMWLVSGVFVLCALVGMLVLAPREALAATATITADIELRDGPGADAVVIMPLPAGSVVTIDGPPANGSYPVTYNGTPGWVSGAVLDITKDALVLDPSGSDAVEAAPSTDATTLPPAAPTVVPPLAPVDEPTAIPVEQEPAVETPVPLPPSAPATEVTTDVAPTEAPAAEPVTATTPVADEAAPPVPPASEAPPLGDAPVAPAATEVSLPSPPAAPATTVTPVVPPAPTVLPEPVSTPEPTPTATPVPTGPATATTDLNLRARPSQSSAALFLVSAGSTVWRTGNADNGYVSVDYMGIVGWIAEAYLAEPGEIVDEATPRPRRVEDEPRTARPGSGIAFTTTRLALREGPSAGTPAITEMPSGARVTLTGVSENGFHRVVFKEQIGWASIAYLSLPANPTVAPSDGGGRGGEGGERRAYTEEQVIKIIYDAADRYNQPRGDMLRVAQCESGLDPYAVNPSGSYGLFQFVPSTWETTPYADQNIFNPRANANAAAWMWSVGRRAEWVCQ